MTLSPMTFFDVDRARLSPMPQGSLRSPTPWRGVVGGLLLAVGLMGCQGAGLTSDRLPSLGLPLPLAQLQGPPVGLDTLPQNPLGQPLTVEGTVTQVAPLGGGGVYQVEDATGTAWMRTENALQEIGAIVRVQGQLQYQSILVVGRDRGEHYLQEQQRTLVAAAGIDDPADDSTTEPAPIESAPAESVPEDPASVPGES